MSKKILNTFLFIAVLAAAIVLTLYVGKGAAGVLVYNFAFLAVMAAAYIAGLLGGMFRMNRLTNALDEAVAELGQLFKVPGRVPAEKIPALNGLFQHRYLDGRMQAFTECLEENGEGLCDIEEYINEDDLDSHLHKRILELAPDLFTSLGILGTFVGLVWGLKNFEPTDYEAMTNSVSALVDGIKVAFLTSIYGISLSIIYSYGMKSEYSALSGSLQRFLDKFHVFVMPSAENESMNLLVASQKNQTAAMEQMAEQFSGQMAQSFEKVITPTFKKMNDSLDTLVSTATRSQEEMVREIVSGFLREMNDSFQSQFADFGKALEHLKAVQTENTNYTTNLYQSMSRQLSDSYVKHEKAMQRIMEDAGESQKEYMAAADRMLKDNQVIQKQQQADYQHLADYLREAETSSAKFWVACNQTMQKYVEAASEGMDQISRSGRVSAEVSRSNQRVVEDFDKKLDDFMQYQKASYKTMEQVRRLLADISANGSGANVHLSGGRLASDNSMKKLTELLEAQGEQQQELLEELSKSVKELSRSSQKGKFSIFR